MSQIREAQETYIHYTTQELGPQFVYVDKINLLLPKPPIAKFYERTVFHKRRREMLSQIVSGGASYQAPGRNILIRKGLKGE